VAFAPSRRDATAGSALDGALSRRKNRRHRWTGHPHRSAGILVRTVACPVPPEARPRLRGARPGTAQPPRLPAPLVVTRRVSVRGAIMVGGQRIQVGLAHARKTVAVTVGPDTIQVAVETSITVTAARTTGRDIRELIVEQEDKERLERGAEEELNRRCGDGTVQKVEVLQYGDDPVIEPGQAMVRVILTPTDEDPEAALHAFERTHSGAIEDLRKTIARAMPSIGRVQLTLPAQPGERKHPVISMSVGPLNRTAPGCSLTAVMARLDPRDVEVLDALITAGIVPNRAEGVRWALARIRERPAYTQLREHVGKIDELKAQL
jgi:hypothetical protein